MKHIKKDFCYLILLFSTVLYANDIINDGSRMLREGIVSHFHDGSFLIQENLIPSWIKNKFPEKFEEDKKFDLFNLQLDGNNIFPFNNIKTIVFNVPKKNKKNKLCDVVTALNNKKISCTVLIYSNKIVVARFSNEKIRRIPINKIKSIAFDVGFKPKSECGTPIIVGKHWTEIPPNISSYESYDCKRFHEKVEQGEIIGKIVKLKFNTAYVLFKSDGIVTCDLSFRKKEKMSNRLKNAERQLNRARGSFGYKSRSTTTKRARDRAMNKLERAYKKEQKNKAKNNISDYSISTLFPKEALPFLGESDKAKEKKTVTREIYILVIDKDTNLALGTHNRLNHYTWK